MKKVYKSKVDTWLIIFICVVVLISVIPLLCTDFSIIDLLITTVFLLLIIIPLFNIKYIIEDKSLKVKLFFVISLAFNLNELQTIRKTRSVLSAPAASLDRLELIFKNKSVIISPKHKKIFIEDIKRVCPNNININL